jgi:hypothetical protein
VKKAAAFMRDGAIYLHPYSQTTQGFWIFSLPVLVTSTEDAGIGEKLLMVLSQSVDGVSHPKTWKGLTDPLLKAARVKSFDAFAKSAKSVDISLDESGLMFTPTLNGGPKRAFLHLNDRATRCQPSEADAMHALLDAFEACEIDGI